MLLRYPLVEKKLVVVTGYLRLNSSIDIFPHHGILRFPMTLTFSGKEGRKRARDMLWREFRITRDRKVRNAATFRMIGGTSSQMEDLWLETDPTGWQQQPSGR
jgi:hypothetical protein